MSGDSANAGHPPKGTDAHATQDPGRTAGAEAAGKTPLGLAFDAKTAARPIDAATVLVLREASRLEVYCVQRHARSPFMGGAIVFPGGKVDANDAAVAATSARDGIDPRVNMLGAADPAALLVAAARELVEEACLLPAATASAGAGRIRAALAAGTTFEAALAAEGLTLELGGLAPFARWITPEAEPRRFDARFFMLPLPEGQEAIHDDHETTLGFWASPSAVLERFHAGDIQLAPPTTRSLEIIASAASIAEAMAIARAQDLRPVCPRFVPADPPFLALPGDPAHEVAETIVRGPSRFVMRDGRLVSEDPS